MASRSWDGKWVSRLLDSHYLHVLLVVESIPAGTPLSSRGRERGWTPNMTPSLLYLDP